MGAGKAEPFAARQLASALIPAARLLDPVHALRQSIAVHHQIVVGERRRGEIIGAAHCDRIERKLVRHLVEQALEGEADVDRAMAAEGAARRRVCEHAPANIFDVMQVVDGVEHRAGIENGHDAVAGMGAAALVAFAFDRADAPVPAHAELEPDVGLGPSAMGDEGLLARGHQPHTAACTPREQCGNELHVERLGTAAEAAAHVRLDHADARHVHVENLRQHEVHVIGNLSAGVHGHAIALGVVVGGRRVHFHLVLTHLGAAIGRFADKIGVAKTLLHAAQLEQHIALDVAGPVRVDVDGLLRQRRRRRVVGRQFPHSKLDERNRFPRGGIVHRGDGCDRLAAIAHLVRQNAESLVAVGAGDDRLDAWQARRHRHVHIEDLGV